MERRRHVNDRNQQGRKRMSEKELERILEQEQDERKVEEAIDKFLAEKGEIQ